MPTTSPYYNPENFALIAGDELSTGRKIPLVFGYYAATAAVEEIMTGALGAVGSLFFGFRTNNSPILPPDEKLLPTATDQLVFGSMILINGAHIDLNGQFGPVNLDPYVLYVSVDSNPGEDTFYTKLYLSPP